jgi:hypothetical protein
MVPVASLIMCSGSTMWMSYILNACYCTLIWILVADTLVAFRLQDFFFTPTRGLKKGRCAEVNLTFIAYYITLQRSYKKQIGLFELQQWPVLTKLSNKLPLNSCVPTSMRNSCTSFKNDQFLLLCYVILNSLYTLCFYRLLTLLTWRNVRILMDTDGDRYILHIVHGFFMSVNCYSFVIPVMLYVSWCWIFRAANLDHGHWTPPYFDCDGKVKHWVITYASPFFGWDSLKVKLEFKWVISSVR